MKRTFLMISALFAAIPATPDIASAHRLTDPGYNRCANESTLPPDQCGRYADVAWNNGSGCITYEEYVYAQNNFIAPVCSLFNPTQLFGWCRCGCFKEGTQVYVSDASGERWAAIEELPGKESKLNLATLSPRATLANLTRDTQGITGMTIGNEEKPLVIIVTQSNKAIALTETHGVLLSSGSMARAGELTTGDTLVAMDGRIEPIRSIHRAPTPDPVYNVLTAAGTENKLGHLIFAQHLVVGDLYWQNILDAEFRDIAVRK